jgi:vacuolar-type H+-ATPase subunit C/Vma6
MSREQYNYKRATIKAAKELHYDETFIQRLIQSQSETEIARIMRTARG